jgi:hypothetical protein
MVGQRWSDTNVAAAIAVPTIAARDSTVTTNVYRAFVDAVANDSIRTNRRNSGL